MNPSENGLGKVVLLIQPFHIKSGSQMHCRDTTKQVTHRGSSIWVQTDHPLASAFRNKGGGSYSFQIKLIVKNGKTVWRRVVFLEDCCAVYHVFLRKLGSPVQQRQKWKCAFSSLCLTASRKFHTGPFALPVSLPQALRPGAPDWSPARQGWLWLWGRWELPVMVYRVFLRRRETKGFSCLPALWSSHSSAHISPGRPKSRKEAPRCTLWASEIILPTILWACSCPLCVTCTPPSAA